MDLQAIVEGGTRLNVPATNLHRTFSPGARAKGQPFYNPGMALNRDLSVALAEAFARAKGREVDLADALCGTGARAVRWATEVEAPIVVHANDADPNAVAAARRNLADNAVAPQRAALSEGDAHAFLAARRYDLVDLDPCGSPMPFLDAAVRATRHDGLVCVTATDTGALAGAFPRACRRRYDAHHGLHAQPWRSEVGLRILAGAIVRSAARMDRVAVPVLSVSKGHWMRVAARIGDGKKEADAVLRHLRAATVQDGLGAWIPTAQPPAQGPWAGPLWSGPLHDAALVEGMQRALRDRAWAQGKPVQALLELLAQECSAPAFWVQPDAFQTAFGPPPRRDVLLQRLRDAGHRAARTHLDPQGVRTDAGLEGLRAAWS